MKQVLCTRRWRYTDRVNMVWLLAASLSDVTISHYHSRPSPRYHITITAVRTVALAAAGRLALDRAPLLPCHWSALLASHWPPPVMKRCFSVTTRHAAGSARPSQDAGVGFGRPSATTTVITAPCPSLFVPRRSGSGRLHICQEVFQICLSLSYGFWHCRVERQFFIPLLDMVSGGDEAPDLALIWPLRALNDNKYCIKK